MATFNTLDGQPPLVVGHRGASGLRPEHTLEAYRVAIENGAEVIEPDLVVTRDGVLIARHEPTLGGTTDVADHPEFAARRVAKVIDGQRVTDWWAEDFTLAEIKTLYARERIPEQRPANTAFDDQFRVPTLAEVIDLVKQVEAESGRVIGIAPETKHPTYFEFNGTYADGSHIGVDTSRVMIDTLVANNFTDPSRIYLQSFEVANLIELQTEIMPAANIDLPLVQLLYGAYDIAFNLDPANAALGADPSRYAALNTPLTAASASNGDLYSAEAIRAMAALYADAIGPSSTGILLGHTLPAAQRADFNGDGRAEITRQLTGEVRPLGERAHAAGIELIPYTVRLEEPFLALNPDGTVQRPVEEFLKLIDAGADAIFTDFPGTLRVIVDQLAAGDGAIAAGNLAGGNDVVVLDPAGLTAAKASAGVDTAIYAGTGRLVLAEGIENAELRGAAGATVQGNDGANRIEGVDGNDRLYGGQGNDALIGGAGNDVLEGGPGTDTTTGGAGDDIHVVDDAADVVIEAANGGYDTVIVTGGRYTLSGNIEVLLGTDAAQRLEGDAGDNLVAGYGGPDVLYGGAGNDVIEGGDGDDVLEGGPGVDITRGGRGNDIHVVEGAFDASNALERAGEGYDTVIVTGTYFEGGLMGEVEVILGTDLDQALIGGYGSELIIGGGGNDALRGAQGDDVLTGGVGRDSFNFTGAERAATYNDVGGRDVITDFTPGEDVIRLSSYVQARSFDAIRGVATQVGDDVSLALTSLVPGSQLFPDGPFYFGQTVVIQNYTLAQLSASDFGLG